MDNTTAVVVTRAGCKCLFPAIQHPIQRLITDCMDSDLHPALMSGCNHLFQLLLGINQQPFFTRRICIPIPKPGSACPKGTVSHQLNRSDFKQIAPHPGGKPDADKLADAVGGGKMALFIDTDGHFTRRFQLMESGDDVPPVQPGKRTKIIGLTGGDACLIELLHSFF